MSHSSAASQADFSPSAESSWDEQERGTLMETLHMRVLERSAERTVVTMPVDGALQVVGIVHGGASAALIETAASVAAREAAPQGHVPVGMELHVNHIKAVREGSITATASPVHCGARSALYRVDVHDGAGNLMATGTLRSMFTMVN
ncbi:PaaI family thioesterase [Actinomyces vulturis]|uniref:PaaI family thioesterase n=1 Tax=Actinomyces vulturis TaxID=1857645 RepID=UPI00082E15B8|nr:PaaI family thioesterase [Actinomyces vulturis]